MKREAIVLAGGLGTRLRAVVADVPKVLAPVAGKPFLEHVLLLLEKNGFSRAILAVSYKREKIISVFGNKFGQIEIEYSVETEPLGTGGAIGLASRQISPGENFFVFNGDTYASIDVDDMEKAFRKKHADAVMAVHEVEDITRYGLVDVDANGMVTGFQEKMSGHAGLINAGVYLMRRDLPSRFSFRGPFSIEVDFLQSKLGELRVAASMTKGYFIDIGVPEDYEKANRELI